MTLCLSDIPGWNYCAIFIYPNWLDTYRYLRKLKGNYVIFAVFSAFDVDEHFCLKFPK